MKMHPLKVVDAENRDVTAATMKKLVKGTVPQREAFKFMVERLGYTQERALLLLPNHSELQ